MNIQHASVAPPVARPSIRSNKLLSKNWLMIIMRLFASVLFACWLNDVYRNDMVNCVTLCACAMHKRRLTAIPNVLVFGERWPNGGSIVQTIRNGAPMLKRFQLSVMSFGEWRFFDRGSIMNWVKKGTQSEWPSNIGGRAKTSVSINNRHRRLIWLSGDQWMCSGLRIRGTSCGGASFLGLLAHNHPRGKGQINSIGCASNDRHRRAAAI